MPETYTTKQVADLTGIPVTKLQFWVREDLICPATTGEGSRKRIHWTEEDVERARQLLDARDREKLVTVLANLTDDSFWTSLEQAVIRRQTASPAEIVVSGNRGARIMRSDTSLAEAARRAGKISILLA